jgi:hypothetical protein
MAKLADARDLKSYPAKNDTLSVHENKANK